MPPALASSPFLAACRRERTGYTPVWIMRQAGRYLPEYRRVRERVDFLTLCKTPELACQVTVDAACRLGVDAAILFADILLIAEPMGMRLEFARGEGPALPDPVRTAARVRALRDVDPQEGLAFVLEAVRLARRALPPHLPLIGFAGAPYTLASYMIEGGATRSFARTKGFMYRQPRAWHHLMALLSRNVGRYLAAQAASGAQALQLFDSWAGSLSPSDYSEYVAPHVAGLIASLPRGVPVIHFGVGTGALLERMAAAGGDVIGVDHTVELGQAWSRLPGRAVQGNLDPAALLGSRRFLEERVARALAQARRRPGHIFNLGHGILPDTPVGSALAMVEMVHELSRR
jgi:uroporphyrinogen decarboxylase